MANHIAEPGKKSTIVRVQYALLKVSIACVTLTTGLLIHSIRQHFCEKAQASPATVIAPDYAPRATAATEQFESSEESYPDNMGTRPSDIEYFIDLHPRANLDRLWRRLNINRDDNLVSFDGQCGFCKAQTFNYNLDDDDADQEIVLRIADGLTGSFRYLIFKFRSYYDTKLLGHIDARSKYRPSSHAVLLSGGKAWLIIESQAASGSGLAAYEQTVYEVSAKGVRRLVSYFSEIRQFGYGAQGFPSKNFFGQAISCEVRGNRARVRVAYNLRYWYDDEETPLFNKQQVAVIEGPFQGERTILNKVGSNITAHEFDSIYNYDSMTPDDFLTYNRSELHSIALGRDATKKLWLKEFLPTCSDGALTRELVKLLH